MNDLPPLDLAVPNRPAKVARDKAARARARAPRKAVSAEKLAASHKAPRVAAPETTRDVSRAFGADQSMGTALRETYRAFARALTPRLQASGVTLAMWFALRELWKRDGMSQVELARAIDSQPSAVVGLVAALRRAGLVRVGPRENDRRVIEVWLTARGRAARTRLAPHGIRLNETALAGFSAAEVKSLFVMLARLRANIEQADNPSR